MPVSSRLALSASRVEDLRLCLVLEMHPTGVSTPEFRQAVDNLRMKASNDDSDCAKARTEVNLFVARFGLADYCRSHLVTPSVESEYFTKMQQFVPGLFIGSAGAASDKASLLGHGITHVCMCLNGGRPPFPSQFQYLVVDVLDVPEVKIAPYFDDSYRFIKQALDGGGKVLIHCAAGISRSASIAIAFLMRDKRMSYDDSLQVVRAVRSFVCPNQGFQVELRQFENKLKLLE
ncbi:hypothetical protein BASA81_010167 [Batrachochytrium salamandrivorans]|nr:hypothetical protein BASA81_010167 [Batrachochytrium salamandrivorans]